MEFDCPLRLCDKTAVDAAVGRPPAADKTVALVVVVVVDVVVVDDVVLMTLAVGKLASVAADTVAVGLMVRAVELGLCALAVGAGAAVEYKAADSVVVVVVVVDDERAAAAVVDNGRVAAAVALAVGADSHPHRAQLVVARRHASNLC